MKNINESIEFLKFQDECPGKILVFIIFTFMKVSAERNKSMTKDPLRGYRQQMKGISSLASNSSILSVREPLSSIASLTFVFAENENIFRIFFINI